MPALDTLPRETIPDECEVRGCSRLVQTWCPLCDTFLCLFHDELMARRGHECLTDGHRTLR
jgi:hypothetical protein